MKQTLLSVIILMSCASTLSAQNDPCLDAVTDCLEDAPQAGDASNHRAQIGIAMDGHAILPHTMADGTEPTDLDQCNGHIGEDGNYHYHAGDPGSNAILGCLAAQTGCALEQADGTCDASVQRRRP